MASSGLSPSEGGGGEPSLHHRNRDYCANGAAVHYEQYDALSHIWSVPIWLPNAIAWINPRFVGVPASTNCASIAPGNSLAPIPEPLSP